MSRPVKRALSLELLIETGLQLAREHGFEQLSIRRIASALGVTPMAVYRHVKDWDTLQAAMLDRFIQQADVLPASDMHWQAWMRHVARHMHTALQAEPGWVALFGRVRLGPHALQVLEQGIVVMMRDGFSPSLALQAQLAMVQCVIGAASLEASFSRHLAGRLPAFEGGVCSAFPHVATHWPALGQAALGDRLQAPLEWLLQGLSDKAGAPGAVANSSDVDAP